MKLNGSATKLLAHLQAIASPNGFVRRKQSQLRGDLGFSPSQLHLALTTLKASGIVASERLANERGRPAVLRLRA